MGAQVEDDFLAFIQELPGKCHDLRRFARTFVPVEESAAVTRRRLGQAMRAARRAIHPESALLEVAAHHVGGEPIPYGDAVGRRFEPFSVGEAWGRAWDTTWFRLQGRVPDAWAGRPVEVLLDLGYRDFDGGGSGGFGAEAMVWSDGEPLAAFTGRHRSMLLSASAKAGERIDWYLEAAANPMVAALFGGGQAAPWRSVDIEGAPLFRLTQAQLALVDTDAEARFYDLSLALDLLDSLPAGQPRHGELQNALVAWFDDGDSEPLKGALAQRSGWRHLVSATGHAHIDTAWLWPLRETRRKVARTWATAARLADEFRDYRFCASAPQHWEWIRTEHPGLFDR